MEQLEAQETMLQLTAHDFPSMKEEQRQKIWDRLNNKAYPASKENVSKGMSNEDLANWLKGALGG